jgi:hypothetical protein
MLTGAGTPTQFTYACMRASGAAQVQTAPGGWTLVCSVAQPAGAIMAAAVACLVRQVPAPHKAHKHTATGGRVCCCQVQLSQALGNSRQSPGLASGHAAPLGTAGLPGPGHHVLLGGRRLLWWPAGRRWCSPGIQSWARRCCFEQGMAQALHATGCMLMAAPEGCCCLSSSNLLL